MKSKDLEQRIQQIRSQDIVPILQNALNYGEPWSALYQAAIEEIIELRQKVIKLTDYVPRISNELLEYQHEEEQESKLDQAIKSAIAGLTRINKD